MAKQTYIMIYECANCGTKKEVEIKKGTVATVNIDITCDYCGCNNWYAPKKPAT